MFANELLSLVVCPVCLKTMADPRMLPCLHSFCGTCLEEISWVTNKGPGDSSSCPECRTQFTVPEIGIAGLPKDRKTARLIEIANKVAPERNINACFVCVKDGDVNSSHAATKHCFECRKNFCDSCFEIQHNSVLSRKHWSFDVHFEPEDQTEVRQCLTPISGLSAIISL
jgi:hypothetical protein